jgi:hypothetical protein
LVRTLEMHTERRLTCGTGSFIKAEVKNGLSTNSLVKKLMHQNQHNLVNCILPIGIEASPASISGRVWCDVPSRTCLAGLSKNPAKDFCSGDLDGAVVICCL